VAYLIDGFNVLHADPRLERLLDTQGPPAACRALVQLLCAWLSIPRRRRPSVTLVLDGRRPAEAGRPGPGPAPGLTIIYMHDEADAELKRRLQRSPGRSTLVSGDREIRDVAVGTGSEAVQPRTFLRQVEEEIDDERDRAERERVPPPVEVGAWLAVFGGAPAPRPAPPSRPKKAPPPPPPAPPPPPPARAKKQPPASNDVQSWVDYFKNAPDAPPKLPPRPKRR
jgi:hypothetical protein